MTDKPYNVLFLCTGNSARSILAEAILNREGRGQFRAYSAGSQPKGQLHPLALETLEEMGFLTEGYRSKDWQLNFVFTVCDNAAGEVCPIWPGQPMTAHWGIADPAAVGGDEEHQRRAFRSAFYSLQRRIGLFLALPLESIDELSLQAQLRAIGKTADARHHAD
jgi:protein-tyrosine-phosphatase